MATNQHGVLRKNWLTAFVLSLFFGGLGVDRFYLGRAGTGVLKLFTFGGFGIWALIDFVMIATKNINGIVWENDGKVAQKKAWTIFGVTMAIGLFLGVVLSLGSDPSTTSNVESATTTTAAESAAMTDSAQNAAPAVAPAPEPAKSNVPAEYESALAKASAYANSMHMSKKGVYDQLTSEYGEKFTAEAAQYAVDNVKADWNANALAKAKIYQNDMNMSPAAIREQLTSSYGEKFTPAEADYAVKNL